MERGAGATRSRLAPRTRPGSLLTNFTAQTTIFGVLSGSTSTDCTDLGLSPHDFHVIPPNQDLYVVQWVSKDTGPSRLLKVPRAFFANLQGDILVVRSGEFDDPRHSCRAMASCLWFTGQAPPLPRHGSLTARTASGPAAVRTRGVRTDVHSQQPVKGGATMKRSSFCGTAELDPGVVYRCFSMWSVSWASLTRVRSKWTTKGSTTVCPTLMTGIPIFRPVRTNAAFAQSFVPTLSQVDSIELCLPLRAVPGSRAERDAVPQPPREQRDRADRRLDLPGAIHVCQRGPGMGGHSCSGSCCSNCVRRA